MSFQLAFHHALEHGVVSGIVLPDSPDPVPEAVIARLHPKEREHALTLKAYRQVSFVGGRLSARAAANQLGVMLGATLPDERGTPVWPSGLTGSISHKRTLAVALMARDRGHRLGVDLEVYEPARPSIESRVLTERELADMADLEGDRRWIATVLRFTIKEAIYKAVDPYVRRYVAFHEAEVSPDRRGAAHVELSLANGEGPFRVEARYAWLHGHVLSTVTIAPGEPVPAPDAKGIDAD